MLRKGNHSGIITLILVIMFIGIFTFSSCKNGTTNSGGNETENIDNDTDIGDGKDGDGKDGDGKDGDGIDGDGKDSDGDGKDGDGKDGDGKDGDGTDPVKTNPTVNTLPTASAITYGDTLSSSTLTGGSASVGGISIDGIFVWTNSAIMPFAGDSSYEVTFKPNNSSNYNNVPGGNVAIFVNKADPIVVWPADLKATLGDKLKDVKLPSNGTGIFSWENDETPVGGSAGDVVQHNLTFTPTNLNYKAVSNIVNIKVEAAPSLTKYTVTFISNGGTIVDPKEVSEGDKVSEPEDMTRQPESCYDFEGWYENPALTIKYNFADKVNKSFTLYAKWTPIDVTIGLNATGDGYIFYKDLTGFDFYTGDGDTKIKAHFLEVALDRLPVKYQWALKGYEGTYVDTGTAIGTGRRNTKRILETLDSLIEDYAPAAKACDKLGDGWFLPSKDELNELYNANSVRKFVDLYGGEYPRYWSSSQMEGGGDHNKAAYFMNFEDGSQSDSYYSVKDIEHYVRAIRAF